MRVVWLDDAPRRRRGRRACPSTIPAVRWGEGLFETMRAEGGRVALLDRHLDRLEASARTLGWAPDAGAAPAWSGAVAAVAEALAPGSGRVRLTRDRPPDPAGRGHARAAPARGAGRRAAPSRSGARGTPARASPSTRASPTPPSGSRSAAPSARAPTTPLLLDADGSPGRGRHRERPLRRRRAPGVRAAPRAAAGHRPRARSWRRSTCSEVAVDEADLAGRRRDHPHQRRARGDGGRRRRRRPRGRRGRGPAGPPRARGPAGGAAGVTRSE